MKHNAGPTKPNRGQRNLNTGLTRANKGPKGNGWAIIGANDAMAQPLSGVLV
jgi:hypothetical protein